jgi:hypothetical protein
MDFDFESVFFCSCVVIFLDVLFYLTNVVPEYLDFFLFSQCKTLRFLKIKEYLTNLKSPTMISHNYFEFLDSEYNTFFTKILSCPFCLNFWACLFCISANCMNFHNLPFIYLLSLIGFFSIKKISS